MLFVLFVNEIVEFVDGEVAEVVEPMGTGFRTAKVKNKKKTKIKHALRKIKHVKKCGLCCSTGAQNRINTLTNCNYDEHDEI